MSIWIDMVKIRQTKKSDFNAIEKILVDGCMLNFPDVDGKKAMARILEKQPRYFLVAEEDKKILGMIRGCYDGSRALIHQLIITSEARGKGVGSDLIKEISKRFKEDGAPSVSVTSTENTVEFYKKLGFSDVNIRLMVNFEIDSLLK
jgi:N-acetylglutamate synthase-like GNAT family acetyltransferase